MQNNLETSRLCIAVSLTSSHTDVVFVFDKCESNCLFLTSVALGDFYCFDKTEWKCMIAVGGARTIVSLL